MTEGMRSGAVAPSHGQLRRLTSVNVQIFKDQRLGRGSFGAVYKAVCDELPCAAKVLHPTLVDHDELGTNTTLRKFEQECRFMDSIRHPNIVLFLGITTDKDSGLPVLLMELLDESLTTMLETSTTTIPYHIQVDICHDVSLALSYLHSHDILHRDLSSNNILMIAKRKAKVTDFGVSRVVDFEHHSSTPLSMCPGTKVYMPPEALNEASKYTEKIDVFSFGVVIIQVLTQLFPDPTSSTEEVHDDPYAGGRQLQAIVIEVDRRKNHIDLIDPNNLLRNIALSCLSNKQSERPRAIELCRRFAELKQYPAYSESRQSDHTFGTLPGKCPTSSTYSSNWTSDSTKLKKKGIMNFPLNHQEDSSKQNLLEIQEKLAKYTDTTKQLQRENEMLKAELQQKERQLQQKDNQLHSKIRETQRVQLELSHMCCQQKEESQGASEKEVLQLRQVNEYLIKGHQKEIRVKDAEIQELKEKLRESEVVMAQFQRTNQDLQTSLEQYTPLSSPTDYSPTTSSLQSLGRRQSSLEKLRMEWRQISGAPSSLHRGASAYHDETVYFTCKSKVFAYSIRHQSWAELPDSPQANGGFVMINEFPTMIGGEKNGRVTKDLVSLMGYTRDCNWIETFPKMPSARTYSSAVVCNNHVVVAGGSLSTTLGEDNLMVVEVMEIGEFKCTWFHVSNLCLPLANASPVVNQGQLMLIGGTDRFGNTTTNLKCTIQDLLDTKIRANTDTQLPRSHTMSSLTIWRKLPDNKLQSSTGVLVKGYLLTMGGTSSDNGKAICTSYMHRYNEFSESWEIVGLMNMARSLSFAVSLPGNKVMVVGGYTSNPFTLTNMAEIATVW